MRFTIILVLIMLAVQNSFGQVLDNQQTQASTHDVQNQQVRNGFIFPPFTGFYPSQSLTAASAPPGFLPVPRGFGGAAPMPYNLMPNYPPQFGFILQQLASLGNPLNFLPPYGTMNSGGFLIPISTTTTITEEVD